MLEHEPVAVTSERVDARRAAMDNESRVVRQRLHRWWVALLLTTTVFCIGISIRYFVVAHLDSSISALFFRAVMLVAHLVMLCAVCLSPAGLIAMLWPHRPRWAIATGAVCASLMALALLIDTHVYQLYRFHINAGVMNLLLGGAASETFIFPRLMYAQALAIALAVAVVMTVTSILLWRAVVRTQARPVFARATAGLIVLCILSFHLTHIWADAVAYEPVLEQTAVLPLRYAATAKRFLRARGVDVRPRQALSSTQDSDTSALSYPLRPLHCRESDRQPNIVFIVIDSWRFDEMNERVTPRIATFAGNTTRFLNHHSGGNATRIGVFSLFYSIPGTYWHQILREQRGPVLIDELLRQRYDVQVYRSAPIYSPEFDRTVFAKVRLSRLRSQGAGPADWDRDLTQDFLAFIKQRAATAPPFFALVFYDSPHSFEVPADYPLKFLPSAPYVNYLRLHPRTDPTPLRNRYRNSLHYVDGLIGEVLDGIRERALLENTIIVITGDHGQEFNDAGKNYWGHASNFTRYQTGVPMLLYVPGRQGAVVDHRTTHFDIAPTLLNEHLGCSSPLDTFSVGRSLFDPSDRDPLVLSEYADFAILQDDSIAVVRKHGVQMFAPDYSRIESALDPGATRAALEQQTRFYKSASWRDDPRPGRTTVASSLK
jgi:membrane-anchored protein YejM (alkaline phosphatase superfamily)